MSWVMFIVATLLVLLSVWIVIPAPAIWAVALSIAASELSPIFLLLTLIVSVITWRVGGTMRTATMVLAAIAAVLFALPVVRYPRDAPFSIRRLLTGLESPGVEVHRGKIDIYEPATGDHHPILVQIYGGAWQRGAPGDNAPFAGYFASRGYAVFAIDYRHAPEAQWPSQMDDVRAALIWIRAHAMEYHADPSRIAILGRSAGAQLAMLAGFQDGAVRAVISYYGPVNLERGWREPPSPDPIGSRPVLEAYLGGTPDQVPDRYAAASPIQFASAKVPPTLLIYGSRDHIVQARYGRDLHARLTAAGAQSRLVEIPWADHAFDFIPGGLGGQLALWHTERFLEQTLRR